MGIKLRYIILCLFGLIQSLYAQTVYSPGEALQHKVDSISSLIDRYTELKNSHLKQENYQEAYQNMNEIERLCSVLCNMVFAEQDNEIQAIEASLEQQRETERLRWTNDSLVYQKHIAEEDNHVLQLEKNAAIKQKVLLENRRYLDSLHQMIALDKAQNEKVSKAMEYRNKMSDAENVLFNVIFFCLFGILLFIYFYLRKKKAYEVKLCIQKAESEKARLLALEMKEKAERASLEAEQSATMKTVFIHNMSHEIRTPLNAIVGFSGILTDSSMELDKESRKEFSDLIEKNSFLLTTLINDILDLSNLTSGQYKMLYGKTSIQDICSTAYNTVKHRTPEGVNMMFDIPQDSPEDMAFYTDSGRVEQVLINYFTNACKYTEKGSIRLTYHVEHESDERLPKDRVIFSVTDTGTGIPPEKAETVFRRFEKLDDFKQGNGLGLNICRTIADRLNGRCWLDTTYTTGCRFCLEIPLLYSLDEVKSFMGADANNIDTL